MCSLKQIPFISANFMKQVHLMTLTSTVCGIHFIFRKHEDPLVKFMHDEMAKFGNMTKV
jgi:hypothetical protein